MNELKSFKKYSWIISIIIAGIVFISGLTANDLTFLPVRYQSIAVGVIGACGILVKIIPENYRVTIAEALVRHEYHNEPKEAVDYSLGDDEGV